MKKSVIDWLLEEDQPAIRYYALVDLLGKSEKDAEVREAYSNIPKRGWALKILRAQNKKGHWESEKSLYRPKYTATNWRSIVLSDLGLTSRNARVRKAAQLFFKEWLPLPSDQNIFNDEVCVVGNTARMLTRFGYEDDFRVRKLFDRLVEDQKEDGGWHCFQSTHGTLDGWEGLAAFAALPREKRTRSMKNTINRGAEFYLERRLFREGARYAPWFRFHYPNHYYYDLLLGLDFMTALGYSSDKRLGDAVSVLKKKRRSDGTWNLDAIHPDVEGSAAEWYENHSKEVIPFALENPASQAR